MIRVAMIGLGFGAEFIPIYQQHPDAELAAICRRDQAGPGRGRRPLRRRQALHGLPRAAPGPRHRRGPHQLADPRSRVDDARGARGRQARRVHGADGDEHRGLRADRRAGRADRPEVHDDGDGRLRPRVPVHQGAVRQGRARQAAVPAGEPHAGHGRLARLLARPAADVVRDALRRPDAGAHRCGRRGGLVLRLGHHPRGPDRALRLAVRRRVRAHQAAGLRRLRAHLPQPVRRRPPVPRELRRVRLQAGVRVDADRGRQARAAHGQEPGAGDPGRDRGAGLRAPPAGADPALHHQGRLRRRGDAPVASPRARATAARTRTSCTSSCPRSTEVREPFPNARRSANWTCVGLCAHESALKGGELVRLPDFTLRPEAVAG